MESRKELSNMEGHNPTTSETPCLELLISALRFFQFAGEKCLARPGGNKRPRGVIGRLRPDLGAHEGEE